jgi:excinuclease ABC subunit B
VIRPTGLVDPEVEVRPVEGQIDDFSGRDKRQSGKERRGCLLPTLTKRMAEDPYRISAAGGG